MSMKKQLIDQSAHFLLAITILLPTALAPGALSYGVAGAALGLVREVTEQGPITSKGSMLDILFWALGGLFVGVVFA